MPGTKKVGELTPILSLDETSLRESPTSESMLNHVESESTSSEDTSQRSPKSSWYENKWIQVSLNVMCVLTGLFWQITLPICASRVRDIGSDVYILLLQPFWAILLSIFSIILAKIIGSKMSCYPDKPWLITGSGLANVATCVLQVYGSVPQRTPPQLQVILSTILVPFTVLVKYLLYKEGINRSQSMCVGFVMVGLAISTVPQFLPSSRAEAALTGDGAMTSLDGEESLVARILWPIAFALGFLPLGLMMVLVERELDNLTPHPLVLHLYVQIVTFLGCLALFWIDVIPGFGMASDLDDFGSRLLRGMTCTFKTTEGCEDFMYRWWSSSLAYALVYITQFLQICYSAGAIYSVLILTTVLPLGSIFWILFTDDPSLGFIWDPKFTIRSTFVFIGLVILMPAVIVYEYITMAKEKGVKNGFEKLDD